MNRSTARLKLEPWETEKHGPSYVETCADPAVMRYIGFGRPMTESEALASSDRHEQHWRKFGFGLWAAIERETGDCLGFVGICHPLWCESFKNEVEVGWRLRQSAWGKGYATEGAQEALTVAFEDLQLEEVLAFVHPDNDRSIGVTKKLGMKFREWTADTDLGVRIHVYRLLRSER
jgi:RimJ/RimL family protein N-acetyltransferase